MKKIISGKRYDTEKAQEIGDAWHGGGPRDFHYYRETLYRKRTGEFFLYGTGNAASKYSRKVGINEWAGDERLVPLTYDEAREWVEKELDADTYEELFGVVEDMEEKTVITLSVPAAVADLLRKEAARTGRSISDIAADAILKAINI